MAKSKAKPKRAAAKRPAAKKASAIPAGFTAVTPYLNIEGAAAALDFYKRVFGAKEVTRMMMPDGKTIMHAEISIGGGRIMMSEACPQMGAPGPKTLGGTAGAVHLYFKNVDDIWQRAIAAGCVAKMPLADMFWGDRWGSLTDPFGHHWSMAQHVKDLTPRQMAAAAKEAFAQMAGEPK
jgi:uncharacterized glyoxalase superfamily protein PhnB